MPKPSRNKPPMEEPESQVDPLDLEIIIPSREIQALVNMVEGGNKTATMDVTARIREIAEKQNPEIFLR